MLSFPEVSLRHFRIVPTLGVIEAERSRKVPVKTGTTNERCDSLIFQ